jgi:hypothetical protein
MKKQNCAVIDYSSKRTPKKKFGTVTPTKIPRSGQVTPIPPSPSRIPLPVRTSEQSRKSTPEWKVTIAPITEPEAFIQATTVGPPPESQECENGLERKEELVLATEISPNSLVLTPDTHADVPQPSSDTSKSPTDVDYVGLSRKREFRERGLQIYKDLGGLQSLLSAKFAQLQTYHHDLQTMEGLELSKPFIETKLNYIGCARDIFDISNNIVISWSPVATKCSDASLAKELLQYLNKAQLLAAQLKPLTNQKEISMSDVDEAALLISCSQNVLEATNHALAAMEAAKLCL